MQRRDTWRAYRDLCHSVPTITPILQVSFYQLRWVTTTPEIRRPRGWPRDSSTPIVSRHSSVAMPRQQTAVPLFTNFFFLLLLSSAFTRTPDTQHTFKSTSMFRFSGIWIRNNDSQIRSLPHLETYKFRWQIIFNYFISRSIEKKLCTIENIRGYLHNTKIYGLDIESCEDCVDVKEKKQKRKRIALAHGFDESA